jgi:hypothetical protein
MQNSFRTYKSIITKNLLDLEWSGYCGPPLPGQLCEIECDALDTSSTFLKSTSRFEITGGKDVTMAPVIRWARLVILSVKRHTMLPVKCCIIRQNIHVMVWLHKSGRWLVRQPHVAISLTSQISWNMSGISPMSSHRCRAHPILLVH